MGVCEKREEVEKRREKGGKTLQMPAIAQLNGIGRRNTARHYDAKEPRENDLLD